jgi:hypothetical protein
MKKEFLLILMFALSISVFPQVGRDGEQDIPDLEKIFSIRDRAGGTHNASNIGLFFENRGKLYPRRITQGPSGEFPINSGNHYIYRINPFVGIPGNVVQGRYTDNEEFEAVGGYQNPELAQVSFSDKPATWHPVNGWPVKDQNGNPLILSDQDSYCAYNDSNNRVKVLGLQIDQVGYTYGVKFAQNLIFFKYIIRNQSSNNYDSLYFALYNDIDVGNISGGNPEYEDDLLGFVKEKNFAYTYDADNFSGEWPGGKVGMMGVVFLQTPEVNGTQLGITDLHYNLYYDDRDIDSIQYGIMSSSPSLYNSSLGPVYFHLGNNTSLHYDDVNTQPSTGLDMVYTMSSGPYLLNAGDSLVFYTAIVAGENQADLFYSLEQAYKIFNFNFEISKPPATPTLYTYPGDKQVALYWNDVAEQSYDVFSGEYDFEGYRIYRSLNKGIDWKMIADFDKVNDLGLDKGLQYSFTDNNVVNGVEYWYSITAYDRGDAELESLESPKGNNNEAINLSVVIPVSAAAGRTPVSSDAAEHVAGVSNYLLIPSPVDNQSLAGGSYDVSFSFKPGTERGKLKTKMEFAVVDSSKTIPHHYGFIFKTPRIFDIVDLTTGDVLKEDNTYIPRAYPGIKYSTNGSVIPGVEIRIFDPNPTAPADSLPSANDRLILNFAMNVIKNGADTVISKRPFDLDMKQSTSDGVFLQLKAPDVVNNVSRIGGNDNFEIDFSVDDETLVKNATYIISVVSRGVNAANEGIISLVVKKDNIETTYDSLKNLSSFIFSGIKAIVKFPAGSPPSPGNIFSVTTVVPVKPNIRDQYNFTVKPAVVNQEMVKQDMHKIKVVPNPYVVSSLWEPEFGELRREPLRQIQFINLPPECTIYIFTVDADLIKTLNHSSQSGTVTWDLRAEGGREIAPGIYIYVVKTAGSEIMDRFAVIK